MEERREGGREEEGRKDKKKFGSPYENFSIYSSVSLWKVKRENSQTMVTVTHKEKKNAQISHL